MVAITLYLIPASVIASEYDNSSWFVEGRYQTSFYQGSDWRENEVDLGGPSNNIISANSEKRNKVNSSGVAVGYVFANKKITMSASYEKFASSVWSSGNYVSRDGRTFDSAHYPMNMHNFMFETAYRFPIDDELHAIGLIGLGQAHVKTDRYTKSFSGVSGTGSIAEKTVKNLSKRIGVGLSKKLNDKISIVGLMQYTDYGYAKTRCCVEGFETFDTEVSAAEASIRVRYYFD